MPSDRYTSLSWWREEDYPRDTSSYVQMDLPEGVEVDTAGVVGDIVRPDSWKFIAFHYMNLDSPLLLRVRDGVKVGGVARVRLHVEGREHFHLRLEVGREAHVEVLLEVSGSGLYTEAVEAKVGEGGSLILNVINAMDGEAVAFVERGMVVEGGGGGRLAGVWLGGRFVMAKHRLKPSGAEAHVEDAQVLVGAHSQHLNLHSHLDFTVPHTRGESNLRAVLKDRASATLYGMIDVRPEAKGTDAFLSEHALLLNGGARANAIPALEIMTDDVRATHSASVGPVDEEKLFYLMSRGLKREEAKRLIVLGFLEPALRKLDEGGRSTVVGRIEEILS